MACEARRDTSGQGLIACNSLYTKLARGPGGKRSAWQSRCQLPSWQGHAETTAKVDFSWRVIQARSRGSLTPPLPRILKLTQSIYRLPTEYSVQTASPTFALGQRLDLSLLKVDQRTRPNKNNGAFCGFILFKYSMPNIKLGERLRGSWVLGNSSLH